MLDPNAPETGDGCRSTRCDTRLIERASEFGIGPRVASRKRGKGPCRGAPLRQPGRERRGILVRRPAWCNVRSRDLAGVGRDDDKDGDLLEVSYVKRPYPCALSPCNRRDPGVVTR